MREIKFRAWNLTKYGEPADDYYAAPNTMIYWSFIQEDKNKWFDVWAWGKDFILMQYTGLKDKKLKDIYEGDIVECTYTAWRKNKPTISRKAIKQIVYNQGGFCIQSNRSKSNFKESHVLRGSKIWNENVLVIGNIYENPKLLK